MAYLFSSESVSEGHPDKVADRISDAILDNYIAGDPNSKVACETMVTTGQVIISGEVKSSASIDIAGVVRRVIADIGYTKAEYRFDAASCGILLAVHEQSADIARGVEREDPMLQGAGDQGMMFGYACNESSNLMPVALDLSHALLKELADIRREGKLMTYLRPDAKSQVTIEYDDNGKPQRIDTIVISTQHDEFLNDDDAMVNQIRKDVENILIPRVIEKDPRYQKLYSGNHKLLINPTGKFVIGGPHGDTGLTGRKIIVDTYGGKGSHGGGAFSGKDPSKVDRSASYATRHIAKNLVAAGVADEVLVQVAYAIGIAEPVSLYVNTYGTSKIGLTDGEIAKKLLSAVDMRPRGIEERLKLRNPMYEETSAYGHMGRTPRTVKKQFTSSMGKVIECETELFTWEKLDLVDNFRNLFF